MNPDQNIIRYRYQGFDDQNCWKKQLKNFVFLSKITIYLSLSLNKDVQATGEDFSHQTRTSSTLKHEIY